MTQINLSTKQKQAQRHREQTCDCQGERGWIGSLELYRMDEQGSSAVQHRALYSIAYDKSEWENIKNNICITESLCYTAEMNIVNQLYFNFKNLYIFGIIFKMLFQNSLFLCACAMRLGSQFPDQELNPHHNSECTDF